MAARTATPAGHALRFELAPSPSSRVATVTAESRPSPSMIPGPRLGPGRALQGSAPASASESLRERAGVAGKGGLGTRPRHAGPQLRLGWPPRRLRAAKGGRGGASESDRPADPKVPSPCPDTVCVRGLPWAPPCRAAPGASECARSTVDNRHGADKDVFKPNPSISKR